MNILPLISTKPEDTKPYKDWLKSCGIEDVVDEDYTMRIWESWLFKSNRFGKKTPESILYKSFPKQAYFKQLDIGIEEKRSSDINVQVLGYKNRMIYKSVLSPTISEHAVRRWWQHTQSKPDILSWVEYACKTLLQSDTTEIYHPKALLIGYVVRSVNEQILFNIDTKDFTRISGVGFRITTILPSDILNQSQRYRWYKLKEAQE